MRYFRAGRVWGVGALVLLGLGFCAGRASRDRLGARLRWSVDSLKATAGDFQRSRDSARYAGERLVAVADSLVRERTQFVRSADVSAQAAARLRAQVHGLDTLLKRVENAADSIPILVEQRDRALEAVDALTSESGQLRTALSRQIEASVILRRRISADSVTLSVTDQRLAVAEGLVAKLAKQGRGCRIPLLGVRCPVVGAGYGLTLAQGEVRHGVTVAALIPLP